MLDPGCSFAEATHIFTVSYLFSRCVESSTFDPFVIMAFHGHLQSFTFLLAAKYTIKLRWLEHLWDHRKLFETWVVGATEG